MRRREMRRGQRERSGNWRADYLETRTVGSFARTAEGKGPRERYLASRQSYFARPFEDFVFICFVYQYSCLMNFMEEEAVKFFSRFRETTSILREKLMFHHKTRFEKTCGSHARGLPQNGDVRMSLVHLLDCRKCF
jgi:hypothetical protein